jgi:hypothetical protein
MKLWTIIVGAATLLLGTAVSAFAWQSADHVKVKVQLTHNVHVNNDVLPPGKYTIETMRGKESSNNILKIYTDHVQTFETRASTIDAPNRDTAEKKRQRSCLSASGAIITWIRYGARAGTLDSDHTTGNC